MTKEGNPLSPVQLTDRIQSLDIMRGIVVLGILIMNINDMGLSGAYYNPSVSGGAAGWDLATWITANMFFEGTMRALFSLLFGVGMFVQKMETAISSGESNTGFFKIDSC